MRTSNCKDGRKEIDTDKISFYRRILGMAIVKIIDQEQKNAYDVEIKVHKE